ncbi:hypothetical protein [Streptomyces hygroscopicus]|uniref:hypothetical protein n=1 Tax=Streptomyces hygroscopicus TaxID=1912 RepID=UPI00133143A6|nr:hypothetical protein [Streptomyces hygroscopicus]
MIDRIFRGAVGPASARSERSMSQLLTWQSHALTVCAVTVRLRVALMALAVVWMIVTGTSLPSAWALPLGVLAAAPGYSCIRYLRIHLP